MPQAASGELCPTFHLEHVRDAGKGTVASQQTTHGNGALFQPPMPLVEGRGTTEIGGYSRPAGAALLWRKEQGELVQFDAAECDPVDNLILKSHHQSQRYRVLAELVIEPIFYIIYARALIISEEKHYLSTRSLLCLLNHILPCCSYLFSVR